MLAKFKNQLSQLLNTEIFSDFIKNHLAAYLSGGFVIVEELANITKFDWQIDYFCPESKRVYTFSLHNGEFLLKDPDKVLQEYKKDIGKLNLDNFKLAPGQVIDIINEDLEKQNKKIIPSKIIITMQNIDGKDIYNIIIITFQFTVLNARIDANTGEVLKLTEQNVMEFGSIEKGKGQR
jgi:hypothetical protein